MADLTWLGVDWDGEVVFQSRRLDQYDAALARLRADGLLYPCFCTRADIQASLTAPHGPEGPVYPGTCRGLSEAERTRRIAAGEAHAWRIDMGRAGARVGTLEWRALSFPSFEPRRDDDDLGGMLQIAAAPLPHGDVVLARKDAPVSYHLAVTLDDAVQGVADVIRGEDLLDATDIHRLLQALLDLPTPRYRHHPLLRDETGARLAKRDNAPALADLRAQGWTPEAVRARIGRMPDALIQPI